MMQGTTNLKRKIRKIKQIKQVGFVSSVRYNYLFRTDKTCFHSLLSQGTAEVTVLYMGSRPAVN